MAIRQLAFVAVLIPAVAFGAYIPNTNTTWNASFAVATLLANKAQVPLAIEAAAGAANATTKLAGVALTSLTCVPSGPSASGILVLAMTDATAALADSLFRRWIAEGIAKVMGCHNSQVDVWVQATRRLTTDGEGRRLTSSVTARYDVYNPNRGRNIGLGIGLGLVAPALGLGLGLGEGLLGDKTPAPTEAPVTVAPVPVATTAAPEEGSSMPMWAGILLGLAILACIGAAIMMATKKEKKKKAPKKKAAPVAMAPVQVVEEVLPLVQAPVAYQQPVQYVTQAAPQYVQQAPPQYVQQGFAAPPAYTSVRTF